MGLSTELISQFAKITNDQKKSRIDEATLYGEVVQCDDSICVRFDGSEQLTPVTTITEKDEEGNITNFKYGAASVKTGDRVSVSLKNHSATITGNLSDPPMGRAEIYTTEDSIIAKVDGQVKMQIDALGVKIDGVATFTNSLAEGLENGTTTINGGCIKTGTIDAQYLNLTGAIKFGDLNSDAQGKINTAQSTADSAKTAASNAQTIANNANTAASNAQSTADSAKSKADSAYTRATNAENAIDKWTYSGTTYIDGSKIMTGTVMASDLLGGSVGLLDSNEDVVGSIDITRTWDGTGLSISTTYGRGGIKIESAGNVYLSSYYDPFIMLGRDTDNNDVVSLGGGKLLIGSEMYGYSLPSSGVYGQLFFLLS